MSIPLDFQTEGPGFESYQVHMVFYIFFVRPIVLKCSNSHECRVFVLIKIEISASGTISSIAIELKNEGQRALSDQKLDGPS